jgi:hypothetical protein
MRAQPAGVVAHQQAGLLGEGEGLGAGFAEVLDQAFGVAQGDTEHGAADRVVVEAAPVEVGSSPPSAQKGQGPV